MFCGIRCHGTGYGNSEGSLQGLHSLANNIKKNPIVNSRWKLPQNSSTRLRDSREVLNRARTETHEQNVQMRISCNSSRHQSIDDHQVRISVFDGLNDGRNELNKLGTIVRHKSWQHISYSSSRIPGTWFLRPRLGKEGNFTALGYFLEQVHYSMPLSSGYP